MLRAFLGLISILACSTTLLAADEVKEIDLKGIKLTRVQGGMPTPTPIASADELQKVVVDKDSAAAIGKQVDFAKQKLVYFAWSGSGQDKVVADRQKDNVVFTLERGRTRDLREHQRMFILGKDENFTLKK